MDTINFLGVSSNVIGRVLDSLLFQSCGFGIGNKSASFHLVGMISSCKHLLINIIRILSAEYVNDIINRDFHGTMSLLFVVE
uniref:Uncharacterized protein n=1 Tax=Rhizophagus irregularis (strain DAOM 181602 / DAOM 197198 / MUCL 43194) TaxID=747089 RepID=U9TE41_RHIID